MIIVEKPHLEVVRLLHNEHGFVDATQGKQNGTGIMEPVPQVGVIRRQALADVKTFARCTIRTPSLRLKPVLREPC